MRPLTDKQQATLDFIRGYIKEHRMAPTAQEISAGMGWSSPNSAQEHIYALKRKGWVTTRRGVSRSLALVESDEISIPEGWKLVPIEPTQEMLNQSHTLCDANCPDCGKGFAVDVTENITSSWEGMLAAAPEERK